jgi:formylglycine-generating enzyme required for sulfatase activity
MHRSLKPKMKDFEMSSRRLMLGFCLAVACGLLAMLQANGVGDDKTTEKTTDKIDLLKIFNAEFVDIVPGHGKFPKSFLMGSKTDPADEQPQHEVTIKAPFAMAKYEVPQALYKSVMGNNPSHWKGARNSTETMTFAEAADFCKQVTTQLQDAKLITKEEEVRLPTEAEWEYCCRAGTATNYSFGDEPKKPDDKEPKASILNDYGWHTGNAAGNDPAVGVLKPNPWGLYDMHGYLWEYVADEWHDNYTGAPADGSKWSSGEMTAPRVLRGGSWKDHYTKLRSTTRRKLDAAAKDDEIGFRCVKAKAPKS